LKRGCVDIDQHLQETRNKRLIKELLPFQYVKQASVTCNTCIVNAKATLVVGLGVGAEVGLTLGATLGVTEGVSVGVSVGTVLGTTLGVTVGRILYNNEITSDVKLFQNVI